MLPSLNPPPTDAMPVLSSTVTFWNPRRSTTIDPSCPPELVEAYEWPPDLAWTLMPFREAQITESETCGVVSGMVMTAGSY